ncbi:hypothetical protein [Streptosporangium sp. NPDC004631]
MSEQTCPTYPWCKITYRHGAVHLALVALLREVSVSIRTVGGPVEVTVTAYEPGTVRAAGIPPTALPPATARSLGQTIAGRDAELGEALIAAADQADQAVEGDTRAHGEA